MWKPHKKKIKGQVGQICHQSWALALVLCTKLYTKLAVPESSITGMNLTLYRATVCMHQANPHIHQQHIVWATTFRSGLPQLLSSQMPVCMQNWHFHFWLWPLITYKRRNPTAIVGEKISLIQWWSENRMFGGHLCRCMLISFLFFRIGEWLYKGNSLNTTDIINYDHDT